MRKAIKIIFIVSLILVIILGGFWAYKKFFTEKLEEINAGDGWTKYVVTREKTLTKSEYWVEYTIEDNRSGDSKKETSGNITVDKYGSYHEWNDGAENKSYVIKANNIQYVVFEDIAGTKTSNKITNSQYDMNYKMISSVQYLQFIGFDSIAKSEEQIKKDFYSSLALVDGEGEFEHIFGKVDEEYVWRTTFKCNYVADGVKYSSELVRDVIFDKRIKEVKIDIVDKQLDGNNKVVKKGKKKTLNMNHKIQYVTNQSLVNADFSEYPIA